MSFRLKLREVGAQGFRKVYESVNGAFEVVVVGHQERPDSDGQEVVLYQIRIAARVNSGRGIGSEGTLAGRVLRIKAEELYEFLRLRFHVRNQGSRLPCRH